MARPRIADGEDSPNIWIEAREGKVFTVLTTHHKKIKMFYKASKYTYLSLRDFGREDDSGTR